MEAGNTVLSGRRVPGPGGAEDAGRSAPVVSGVTRVLLYTRSRSSHNPLFSKSCPNPFLLPWLPLFKSLFFGTYLTKGLVAKYEVTQLTTPQSPFGDSSPCTGEPMGWSKFPSSRHTRSLPCVKGGGPAKGRVGGIDECSKGLLQNHHFATGPCYLRVTGKFWGQTPPVYRCFPMKNRATQPGPVWAPMTGPM